MGANLTIPRRADGHQSRGRAHHASGSHQASAPPRPLRGPVLSECSSPGPPSGGYFSGDFMLGAGMLILQPETKRIVVIHDPLTEEWFLPKGRKDVGESLEQAALREAHEETGYRAEFLPIHLKHRQPDPSRRWWRPTTEAFFIDVHTSPPRPAMTYFVQDDPAESLASQSHSLQNQGVQGQTAHNGPPRDQGHASQRHPVQNQPVQSQNTHGSILQDRHSQTNAAPRDQTAHQPAQKRAVHRRAVAGHVYYQFFYLGRIPVDAVRDLNTQMPDEVDYQVHLLKPEEAFEKMRRSRHGRIAELGWEAWNYSLEVEQDVQREMQRMRAEAAQRMSSARREST